MMPNWTKKAPAPRAAARQGMPGPVSAEREPPEPPPRSMGLQAALARPSPAGDDAAAGGDRARPGSGKPERTAHDASRNSTATDRAAPEAAATPVHRQRDPRSPGARATREWRARKAKGIRLVDVGLMTFEADILVELGLVEPAKRNDSRSVARAVLALVEDGIERRLPGTYRDRRSSPASQRLVAEARLRSGRW